MRFLSKKFLCFLYFSRKFGFWTKFNFWWKFLCLPKNWILDKIRFLMKISMSDKNLDFWQKFRFLTNFWEKLLHVNNFLKSWINTEIITAKCLFFRKCYRRLISNFIEWHFPHCSGVWKLRAQTARESLCYHANLIFLRPICLMIPLNACDISHKCHWRRFFRRVQTSVQHLTT